MPEPNRVQVETQRIYSIYYSERLGSRASVKAGELVRQGAIGKVLQTVALGPSPSAAGESTRLVFRTRAVRRDLCVIGSHQFDRFLFFTGSTRGEIVAAQTGNLHHPRYPGLEDFGDALVRGNGGTGYHRVDWFTPDGLPTWGDGRLTILGSEGYIELRKSVDIAGR